MPSKYFQDRYDVDAIRLKPEESQRDLSLVEALASIGVHGNIFHFLEEVPDQFEIEYVILVDSKLVVSFEQSRQEQCPFPEAVKI